MKKPKRNLKTKDFSELFNQFQKYFTISRFFTFWRIEIESRFYFQVTQISCYDTLLAPSGCTQYFYGFTRYNFLQSFWIAESCKKLERCSK